MTDDTAKPSGPRKGRMPAPPKPERRARGFLRAAELTGGMLKSAGAKRGFAELRLLTEWQAVVGDALANLCRPVKVTYGGRGGPGLGATLVVTGAGARGPEIEMQKMRIIEKVNAFYGYRAVSRLVIDQSRTGMAWAQNAGFAEAQTEFRGAAVSDKPAEGVTDERLALALGRLGANVTKRKRPPMEGASEKNRKDRSL